MYTFFMFLAILAIVGFVVYLNIQDFQKHPPKNKRDDRHYGNTNYASFGKLEKPVENDKPKVLFTYKNVGTALTPEVFLEHGVYYIVCQSEVPLQVTLVAVETSTERKLIAQHKTGFTTLSFSVNRSRQYQLEVATEDTLHQWAVLIKTL